LPALAVKNPAILIMARKKSFLLLTAWISLFFLGACSSPSAFVSKDFHRNGEGGWVAVLPFSRGKDVGCEIGIEEILRKRFYETFAYLGYLDRDRDAVDRKLKKLGLDDPRTRDTQLSPQKLGEILGADYLIFGNVHKAVNQNGVLFSETVIAGKIRMVDVRTGKTVWEKKHQESILSSIIVPDSAVTMIEDKVQHANAKEIFSSVAETFAKKVVATIPDPTPRLARNVRLPKIQKIDIRMEGGTTDQAPVLKVAMLGEPALRGAFDIGSWKTNIPMKEVRPGFYEGVYTTGPGERGKGCLIIGKLTGKDGLTGTKVCRKQLVRLGDQ